MLEIGWSELLVIAVVAIVVVGPKELPAMLRAFGKTVGGLKRTANEFRAQFDEAVRQSELESLRAEVESVRKIDPSAPIRKAIEAPHTSHRPSEPPQAGPAAETESPGNAAPIPSAEIHGPPEKVS